MQLQKFFIPKGWRAGLYYLLAKGANCLIADNDGRLPLHAATYFSNEKYTIIIFF